MTRWQPSDGGEGANSWPGKYPGKYKLTTMKSLIYTIFQNIFKAPKSAAIAYVYSPSNGYMCICCCI